MKNIKKRIETLLNSVFKYLVAATLIFVPLYPKFPLFTLPFTYVSIRSEDFLIAITLGVLILKLIFEKKLKFPPVSFQFGVYLLVGLLSVVSAVFITKNVNPALVVLHYIRRIEYLSLFFIVYFAAKESGSRKYFFELAIYPALGVLLYGLAQIYLGAPVISTMDSESSKGIALTLRPGVMLNSTFAGHYDLAIYLIMIMTFLASLSFSFKKNLNKILITLPFLALLWLFMQAGSRIGLIGLSLSICVLTYHYRNLVLGFIYLCLIFSSVLTSPQYIGRFMNIYEVVKDKFTMQQIFKPVFAAEAVEKQRSIQKDTSTSIRFDVEWPRAMRSFYKNPFLGTGYSSISLATDNDYLRALGETGLLGLLSFLSLLLYLFKRINVLIKKTVGLDKIICISALGIFTAFSVSAVFIDVFESSKIAILFWSYMGLSFSTDNNI